MGDMKRETMFMVAAIVLLVVLLFVLDAPRAMHSKPEPAPVTATTERFGLFDTAGYYAKAAQQRASQVL